MNRCPMARPTPVLFAALALAVSLATPARAVDFPAPSPASLLKQHVGLTDIEISYSRPGVKGRQIFGSLLPYGHVWRTGANSSTKISFSTPVNFGGTNVPAGTYALYSIPGENEWVVILSKKTELWGAFGYDPKDDFVRVMVAPKKLTESVETLRIDINEIRDASATLVIEWQQTRVAVTLAFNYTDQLVAELEATMAGPDAKKPFHQAAAYYFDHELDLQKARAWVEAAITENPHAYWSLNLKARILARLGDKDGTIDAARKSLALAEKAGDDAYIKSNRDLLETRN